MRLPSSSTLLSLSKPRTSSWRPAASAAVAAHGNDSLRSSSLTTAATPRLKTTISTGGVFLNQPMIQQQQQSCARRSFSQYSRMLDLGGAPSSSTSSTSSIRLPNQNRHLAVQAVVFEWGVLTKSVQTDVSQQQKEPTKSSSSSSDSSSSNPVVGSLQPNVNKIQEVASLLNVKLGDTSDHKSNQARALSQKEENDLARLISMSDEKQKYAKQESEREAAKEKQVKNPLAALDIRNKYLSKLSQKGIAGGIGGLDRAKEEAHHAMKDGDAAGHLAARKVVSSTPVNEALSTSGSRWMAMTGTGHLLQYLTQRSMQIVLLPTSTLQQQQKKNQSENVSPIQARKKEAQDMQEFQRQLKEVVIDRLILPIHVSQQQQPQTTDHEKEPPARSAAEIVSDALEGLDLQKSPEKCILVSDHDEYLKAAKDAGMVTCRVRPLNAPRGNVSVHYMIQGLPALEQTLNDINGVSFKAALSGR